MKVSELMPKDEPVFVRFVEPTACAPLMYDDDIYLESDLISSCPAIDVKQGVSQAELERFLKGYLTYYFQLDSHDIQGTDRIYEDVAHIGYARYMKISPEEVTYGRLFSKDGEGGIEDIHAIVWTMFDQLGDVIGVHCSTEPGGGTDEHCIDNDGILPFSEIITVADLIQSYSQVLSKLGRLN